MDNRSDGIKDKNRQRYQNNQSAMIGIPEEQFSGGYDRQHRRVKLISSDKIPKPFNDSILAYS